jgi:Leucine-rich repeat (LRR) protein
MDVVRSMRTSFGQTPRDKVTDFTPLAECKELREAVLEGMHVGDLSIFANATKLERLDLENSTVSNPEAIAALPALSALDLQKTEGVTDISIFKDLPKLNYIYSKKGQFPEEQLAPFEKKAVVQ